MSEKEAEARVLIDAALRTAGWRLPGDANPNVKMEYGDAETRIDYMLFDDDNYPLVVVEAKSADKMPLEGKEQAREYAEKYNVHFVILTNGELHYFWDMRSGDPQSIQSIPTLRSVMECRKRPKPKPIGGESIKADYVAESQKANAAKRMLRDYQINAVCAVQNDAQKGKDRFLLEMATGTGKTIIAAALIKMFLRTGCARRVLFLVDRLELEQQAKDNFDDYLAADYRAVIYKHHRNDWQQAQIVVSTVQSLAFGKRYLGEFSSLDFDLLIVDEAHRCIAGKNSRGVFNHFSGAKIGLTATPHDFMKGVDKQATGGKALEARLLRDTYETFGCKAGEPTFCYKLEDGATQGHLLRPNVLDARTEITTQLLSEQGYDVVAIDDATGEEKEMNFSRGGYERTLFSENTNISFCRAFMDRALHDPISNETGKSIVYCVNQKHAAKITGILNKMATAMFPGKYNSDFAVQITSNQPDAQDDSRRFAANSLNGKTRFLEGYNSAKTRVCVTVEMMTTGYDCPDLLNLCFARPVFSPSLFAQIKGRGTRKHTFSHDLGRGDKKECQKDKFFIFDFFAVCDYFEKDFNYDDKLELPNADDNQSESGGDENAPGKTTLHKPDPIARITETEQVRFRVDEPAFQRYADSITQDDIIRRAVEDENWPVAIARTMEHYENKPDDYATPQKIAADNNLKRLLQTREVLELIFKRIAKLKNRDEMLADEARMFCAIHAMPEADVARAAYALKAYIDNREVRGIIDKGAPGRLMNNPVLPEEDWHSLGKQLQNAVVGHAKEETDMEVFDADWKAVG